MEPIVLAPLKGITTLAAPLKGITTLIAPLKSIKVLIALLKDIETLVALLPPLVEFQTLTVYLETFFVHLLSMIKRDCNHKVTDS